MELQEYISEMTKNLFKPLMDMLSEKHDLCFDKDNQLTTYGKTLVEGYNAMLSIMLKEWVKNNKKEE